MIITETKHCEKVKVKRKVRIPLARIFSHKHFSFQ